MNARSAQALAAVLGFLLIVLIGASIFLLLTQHAPRATLAPVTAPPSPSIVPPTLVPATGTPSLPPPTTCCTTMATLTPSPKPTPTPPPTPTPSPTPSATPTPTVSPTSPQRQLRMIDLGLDNRDPTVGIERIATFNVDGPSLISAKLSNVSAGQVRMCLWQGDDITDRVCRTVHRGKLQVPTFGAGQTIWHLSLIGNDPHVSPYVTVTLDFNAEQPSVRVDNLRFQGMPMTNYNGITAAVDALADGQLQVTGAFDAGHAHSYHVVIEDLGGGGVIYDQTGGPAGSFSVSQPVSGGSSYRVTVSNPNDQVETSAVFLAVTISWP